MDLKRPVDFGTPLSFEEIAGAGIDDIRVAGVHADRADGAAGQEIGERLPGCRRRWPTSKRRHWRWRCTW